MVYLILVLLVYLTQELMEYSIQEVQVYSIQEVTEYSIQEAQVYLIQEPMVYLLSEVLVYLFWGFAKQAYFEKLYLNDWIDLLQDLLISIYVVLNEDHFKNSVLFEI